ncbi:unnamed protein product [Sphagnum tenellum]
MQDATKEGNDKALTNVVFLAPGKSMRTRNNGEDPGMARSKQQKLSDTKPGKSKAATANWRVQTMAVPKIVSSWRGGSTYRGNRAHSTAPARKDKRGLACRGKGSPRNSLPDRCVDEVLKFQADFAAPKQQQRL